MNNRFGLDVADTTDNTVGFDPMALSFFFQSQDEDDQGRPKVWLGYRTYQFQRLVDLERAIARAYGLPYFQIDTHTQALLVAAAKRTYQQMYTQKQLTRAQWSEWVALIEQVDAPEPELVD